MNNETVTTEFLEKREQMLRAYRDAAGARHPARCRLVQYTGAGMPNARDVHPGQVEHEMAFALAEGLLVAWRFEGPVLYLCTQEPGCPIPPWSKAIAEEALVDVDALLRDAGLGA